MALMALLGLCLALSLARGGEQVEFTRLVAHWSGYGGKDYVEFIDEAQPEVAQIGFYGAHFWSLVHTPQFSGYPAHFPVRGLKECGDWFRTRNRELNRLGVKVIGHFNVEFLVGDPDGPDGPRGFFKFFREGWDEGVLGPKPDVDPLELLEKKSDGTPMVQSTYRIGGMKEYFACLRNPAWQQVLRAWVRHGVAVGLDGFMINYFYRHDCLCRHCQAAFRGYMRKRFTDEELKEKFAIDSLGKHEFEEIVSWHDPTNSTPLRLEMLRFSQISNKRVFDEVFVRYGRSLKPGLILGQWNHLGDFNQVSGDERCLLPGELWGRDETYAWYSTGGAANYTDLKNRYLGEGTLQARYIRGAFNDKPFTLGKYESTRIRASISELAANGGAPMGFYTRFSDPEARRVIVQYYRFLKKYDDLFRGNRSHAEVALLYPRTLVHKGDVTSVGAFRKLGLALLDEHVLFEVFPDDQFQARESHPYQRVITVKDTVDGLANRLPVQRSVFDAPGTVRVSANRPAGTNRELDFHFVNYNREEPSPGPDGRPSAGGGIHDEKPVPIAGIRADVALPSGARVVSVGFICPETSKEKLLDSEQLMGRVQFTVPEFKVYAIVRVRLKQDE